MNIYQDNFLTMNLNQVFDVIVMNPPYQTNNEGEKKTHPIWDKFVNKSILSCLVEGGYLTAVHPSGWRNVDGRLKDTQILLKSKQLSYLEIHNEKDGIKTFGAETRYDFYCVHNSPSNGNLTTIKGQDGIIEKINISQIEFIPNGMFEEISKLVAKKGEEKVEILHSYSAYETRKEYMLKEQTEEFKYPCVYTVKSGDILTYFYSKLNTNGHFNNSKLIWSNGRISSVGSFVDEKGQYGLTQFTYAIVDKSENLPFIKKAFDSKKFRDLMEICAVADLSINRKIIATFRKDFWKEFLD
jgi:hypothetical protein